MPVLVVINEGASCIPADLRSRLCQSSLLDNIGKGTVAIVSIKCILAVIRHKQIVVAVVVVVANAAGLPPAGFMLQAGTDRYIRKGPVAIVLEQMAAWLLPCRKS